jgi:hypothetical protein
MKSQINEPFCTWKPNWAESRQHYVDWWNHTGLVIGGWGTPPLPVPHDPTPVPPPPPGGDRARFEDVEWRAQQAFAWLGKCHFGADHLAMAETQLGPNTLALLLGAEARFTPETIWIDPTLNTVPEVHSLPPFRLDRDSRWLRLIEAQGRRHKELSAGRYLVGLPLLVSNFDILGTLRDPQLLLMDMVDNPEWVIRAMQEINQAYFEAYDRIYNICKDPDGGVGSWGYSQWAPGKTDLVTCDIAAMISPEMFRDFVKPALAEQCAWLDYPILHLDGTQCLCHLDHILDIEPLKAVEWTPNTDEPGQHERWFPIYKRILDAGKSVQILGGSTDTIEPILKAIGSKGVYIYGSNNTIEEIEASARIGDRWR